MSAANAIKEFFASKKVSAKVVDAIEYISPLLNKTVTEVYELDRRHGRGCSSKRTEVLSIL